jgi:hypothetical protein
MLLSAMVAAGLYWFFQQPIVVGVLVFVTGVGVWIQMIWDARSRRRLAAARAEESICEFARSFDRQTDTWVIRAVYEELSQYLTIDGRPIPVRRHDRWDEDLRIDSGDFEDIAEDAAFRAGRTLDDCSANPLYGKVHTVGDLVSFLEHQPRIAKNHCDTKQ